jgi:hypothetical protein
MLPSDSPYKGKKTPLGKENNPWPTSPRFFLFSSFLPSFLLSPTAMASAIVSAIAASATQSDVPRTDLSDAERGIDCAVLLHKKDVSEPMLRQMRAMSMRPDVDHARFMADCHPVKHSIVGQTSRLTDKVDPATVGGDQGCGVSAYCVGVSTGKLRLEKTKVQIEARLPRGSGPSGIFLPDQAYATETDLEAMLDAYATALDHLRTNYAARFSIDIGACITIPTRDELTPRWFRERCSILKQNPDEALRSLGTLGAGNHHCELSRDAQDQIWVVVRRPPWGAYSYALQQS